MMNFSRNFAKMIPNIRILTNVWRFFEKRR